MADTGQTTNASTQATLKGAAGKNGQNGLRVEKRSGDYATNAVQADNNAKTLNSQLPDDTKGFDDSDKGWFGYHLTTGIFATAVGGKGGHGGDGGPGGNVIGNGTAGDGGDGGDGGIGGDAASFIYNASVPAGNGNDKIALFSTAIGGKGGDGGRGGMGGSVFGNGTAGDGGDGGDGGNGGSAWANILDTSINAGAGHDWIGLFAKAVGGSGGDGGRGGRPGFSGGGTAGSHGADGNGGTADALIQGMNVDGGQGNDYIAISLAAKAGSAGRGPGPGGVNGSAYVALVDNTFSGGAGNDIFKLSTYVNPASSTCQISGNKFDGGDGRDLLDLSSLSVKAIVNLAACTLAFGSQPSANANTIFSIEEIVGTKYADQFVLAGSGARVAGGSGGDSFQLAAGANGKADVIADFSRSGGDKLIVDADDFGQGLKAGSPIYLATVKDKSMAQKAGAGGYFIYDTDGKDDGTLYFDPTGGKGDDAFSVAFLSNKASLSAYDFVVV